MPLLFSDIFSKRPKYKKYNSQAVHSVHPSSTFSCLLSNPSDPASCISINSSCPSHVCFCAVCGWIAPWTGPAHCVHLLCCWCSGCLQHRRYSYPEIVSGITTYTRIVQWHRPLESVMLLRVILEQPLSDYVCLWWLCAREFQDTIAHIAVPSDCEPVFFTKSWSSASFSLPWILLLDFPRKSCKWEIAAVLLLLKQFFL